MNNLWILGAGEYGHVAKEVAAAMGVYGEIFFLDDGSPLAKGKLELVDTIDEDVFVAMGNADLRKMWYKRVKKPAMLIHPTAVVMPSAQIEKGCILEPGVVVCSNAFVETGCILMSNCVIGHNARVEEFCQIKYGAIVTERAVVARGSKVDCNAVV